jgi:hypothetical protein
MSANETQSENLYGGEFIGLDSYNETKRLELVEELFRGEILSWAAKRGQVLGDYVMPKIFYIEPTDTGPHKVAWVEHKGTDGATFEPFHRYHVVCECVLCKNFNNGKGGIDTSQCEVMEHALEARAHAVGESFRRTIDVSHAHSAVNVLTGSSEIPKEFDFESMSLSALEQILRLDKAHPEEWQGNAVSGALPLEQAGKIIAQPLEAVRHYAELLQRSGIAEFDGEALRLAA